MVIFGLTAEEVTAKRARTEVPRSAIDNSPALKEALGETLDAAMRGKNNAAFLLLAVDNLTLINDSYGFDVADEVIIGVGQRLRGLARRVDAVGRYSGNKFGLVLRNCSKERLIAVTERLLASVRDQVIQTSRGPVATTVSAGCVSLPAHAQSIYREAFNHAFASHAGEADQEVRAHKIAWSAVKHSYEKVGDSWIARLVV